MAGLTAQERQVRMRKRVDRLVVFTAIHAVVTAGLVVVVSCILTGVL